MSIVSLKGPSAAAHTRAHARTRARRQDGQRQEFILRRADRRGAEKAKPRRAAGSP